MKKLILVAALVTSSVLTAHAQATTTNGTFNVVINLTSACVYTKSSDVSFAYTQFQTTASTAIAGGFTVKCSNNTAYTLALDATTITDQATNLTYTLALSGTGGTGTGVAQPFSVSGTMPANQSGTCPTPSTNGCTNSTSTNSIRTVTISY